MQSEVYEGRSSAMRTNTCWLASEDIIDRGDTKVTIENVFRHKDAEFDAGRKEKLIFALKFKGSDKQMVMNSTNRKILVSMFGTDTKAWRGKQVTLYVTEVKAFGEIRHGLRIRLQRGPQPTSAKADNCDPHESTTERIESHGADETRPETLQPDGELTDAEKAEIAAAEAEEQPRGRKQKELMA